MPDGENAWDDEEPQEDTTNQGDGSLEDVEKEAETEGYVLGRYLTSLKASYTSQWNAGLLTARPYRCTAGRGEEGRERRERV